jgi:hypothetical protein
MIGYRYSRMLLFVDRLPRRRGGQHCSWKDVGHPRLAAVPLSQSRNLFWQHLKVGLAILSVALLSKPIQKGVRVERLRSAYHCSKLMHDCALDHYFLLKIVCKSFSFAYRGLTAQDNG